MEAQLIQSQKMEAIGTLAGGIAHDFNNILGAIIGYAEMALDEIAAGSASPECVEQILKAGERAKYLVQQILAFSRHAKVEKKLLMIVPLIKEVVKLLRHALPATIGIKEDIHIRDGFILADPTQIHQVLMNLCTNSGHAMREHGGTLTISLRQAVFASDRICGHDWLKAGSYLELKVTDTGHGIDPSIIDHIFEPFFTTKKQGEGTGMGLSIVYGIIKSCDGSISVESRPGAQTIFTIYLPQQQPATLAANDPAPVQKAGGTEKILLVEDRDDMLRMMHNMLTRLGYGVTARQNPLDAVVLFKSDPAAFDMIITDQTMPHLTGADMAKEALSIRPDIPIILCTGFSDLVSSEEAKAMGIREYLSKPIVTRELARAIRNIFDHEKTELGEDLRPDGKSSDN
jgi:CheY-like chemotaxis protein